MFFGDDDNNSSFDALLVNYLKQEFENSFEEKEITTSDAFRCLIINFKSSAMVEFLDALLMLEIFCKNAQLIEGSINHFP